MEKRSIHDIPRYPDGKHVKVCRCGREFETSFPGLEVCRDCIAADDLERSRSRAVVTPHESVPAALRDGSPSGHLLNAMTGGKVVITYYNASVAHTKDACAGLCYWARQGIRHRYVSALDLDRTMIEQLSSVPVMVLDHIGARDTESAWANTAHLLTRRMFNEHKTIALLSCPLSLAQKKGHAVASILAAGREVRL